MTTSASTDPLMDAIGSAITAGRAGDTRSARRKLRALWSEIGVLGDPLHRCTLAHYLADLYDDAAQALAWDVRALDAADALTEDRLKEHHASLNIASFFPSLHLNLADNFRRLGSFDAAQEQIDAARECSSSLENDAYGDGIRAAIDEVVDAVARRDAARRTSALGPVN